jgi:hypothetical protein
VILSRINLIVRFVVDKLRNDLFGGEIGKEADQYRPNGPNLSSGAPFGFFIAINLDNYRPCETVTLKSGMIEPRNNSCRRAQAERAYTRRVPVAALAALVPDAPSLYSAGSLKATLMTRLNLVLQSFNQAHD